MVPVESCNYISEMTPLFIAHCSVVLRIQVSFRWCRVLFLTKAEFFIPNSRMFSTIYHHTQYI